jgi:hypothetical protein
MSFSDEPIIPTDPEKPPKGETAAERVRRRRATRRQMIPMDMEGQSELISTLAKRAYPSVELFIFSLLCGAIMGLGFLLDSQAVLLLGILLTPLMTPWVGFLLAILTGNIRFLLQMLMALLVSAFLVFIGGLITGFASRFFEPITWSNVFIHASLWKPVLVVLGFGAVTLVASFVRSEARPYLPSVIIAFGFFLPVNAAGFGLGAGLPGVWPNGLFVFVAHLVIATVLGLITLFVLKIRPTPTGMIASAVIGIISLLILFNLLKPNTSSPDQAATSFTPTNPPTPLRSPTNGSAVTSTSIILPASTSTPNSVNFTETVAVALTQVAQTRSAPTSTPTPGTPTPVPLTLAITLPASQTPTVTMTIEIQPISGRVSASEGGGANLRQTPNGKYLMTLDNGAIVEIYPDFKQVNGVTWIHVFATRNGQRVEGWLLESVVSYATPEPNFEPSNTPNP